MVPNNIYRTILIKLFLFIKLFDKYKKVKTMTRKRCEIDVEKVRELARTNSLLGVSKLLGVSREALRLRAEENDIDFTRAIAVKRRNLLKYGVEAFDLTEEALIPKKRGRKANLSYKMSVEDFNEGLSSINAVGEKSKDDYLREQLRKFEESSNSSSNGERELKKLKNKLLNKKVLKIDVNQKRSHSTPLNKKFETPYSLNQVLVCKSKLTNQKQINTKINTNSKTTNTVILKMLEELSKDLCKKVRESRDLEQKIITLRSLM